MNSQSRTKYSTLNILTGLGGYVVNTLLGVACRIVFARTLSADYLGINGLFSNILSMLSLAELGIGGAIIYALYKPLASNDEEKIAALVQFYGKCYRVIGSLIFIVGLALMPFLDKLIPTHPAINENIYLIYAIYLFNSASSYFFSYRSSLIAAAQQNYIVVGLNYVITILQSIIQILWLIYTREYLGYLIIASIGTLLFNIIISQIAVKKFPFIVKKNINPINSEEKHELVKNVRALTIWKLSGLLVNSTDNIIISYFKGLVTVGLASNYNLLSSTINSLLNQVFNGLGASIGNLNAKESLDKRMSMFYTINLANFWLFGWASIGIFVVSNDMIHLLFGEKYVLPLDIPAVIALNFYMVGIQNAVWSFQNANGLFYQGRYLLIFTAAINLCLSIVLGRSWGLFGILIATAISRLLTNTWYDPYKLFHYGFKRSVLPYYLKRLEYFFIIIFIMIICYYVGKLSTTTLLYNCLYKFIICTLIPNAIFIFIFHNTDEYKYLKTYFISIINKMVLKK